MTSQQSWCGTWQASGPPVLMVTMSWLPGIRRVLLYSIHIRYSSGGSKATGKFTHPPSVPLCHSFFCSLHSVILLLLHPFNKWLRQLSCSAEHWIVLSCRYPWSVNILYPTLCANTQELVCIGNPQLFGIYQFSLMKKFKWLTQVRSETFRGLAWKV